MSSRPSQRTGSSNNNKKEEWHLPADERLHYSEVFFWLRSIFAAIFFAIAIVLAAIPYYAQNAASPVFGFVQVAVSIVFLSVDACDNGKMLTPRDHDMSYDALKKQAYVLGPVVSADLMGIIVGGIQFGAPGNCVGLQANILLVGASCLILAADALHGFFRATCHPGTVKLGWGKHGYPGALSDMDGKASGSSSGRGAAAGSSSSNDVSYGSGRGKGQQSYQLIERTPPPRDSTPPVRYSSSSSK